MFGRIFSRFVFKKSEFKGHFADFDSAMAQCSTMGGYDNEAFCHSQAAIVSPFVPFTAIDNSLYAQTLGAFFCAYAQRRESATLTVLDFGGASGGYYRLVRSFVPEQLRLSWSIVETPNLVEALKARNFLHPLKPGDSIGVFADIPQESFDIVFASGVLNYLPQPDSWLDRLAKISATHVLLARVPVANVAQDYVVIQCQSSPGRKLYNERPFWVFSRQALDRKLGRHWMVRGSWQVGASTRDKNLGITYESRLLQALPGDDGKPAT